MTKAEEMALEAKVAANMAKADMMDDDALEATVEEKVEEKEIEEKVEEKEVEEEVVEEKEGEVVEEKVEEKKVEEEAVADAPTLLDSHVRAAIHQGWTQEEVDEFFGSDPAKAKKTFEKIYDSTNKISQQFAELGRKSIEKNNQQKTDTSEKKTSKKVEVDYTALEKEYGSNDPLVAAMKVRDGQIEMLVDRLEEISTATPAEKQAVKDEVDSAVVAQLDSFFGDPNMTSCYDDFYGDISKKSNDWNSLTPGQQANRWAVVTMADEILVGTEMQGRKIEMGEALKLAHLAVSDPIKEQVIRTKIKKQLKKRSKSITLPPNSGNKNAAKTTGKKSSAELEKQVAEKLLKLQR